MKENNLKLLIAKILGIVVIAISLFMLVNVFSYLFENMTKSDNIIAIINTILTIIYVIVIILASVGVFIQLLKFKDDKKLKKRIFYLSILILAFYISVLQDKMAIAYAVYFIVTVYFLMIFMLVKDVFKKEEIKIKEDIKGNKKQNKKGKLLPLIIVPVILIVMAFQTLSYINILKIANKYNELNSQIKELNNVNVLEDNQTESNQEDITEENFNKAFRNEALSYILKMIYLSITILLIILATFMHNSKLKKINDINLWILLIVSAFLSSGIAAYYFIAPVVVCYKIAEEWVDYSVNFSCIVLIYENLTSEKIGRERIYKNERLFKIIKEAEKI